MPDIDFERITVNMVPTGEMPVFHASQYETARPFIADLKWGDEVFTPGDGCWAEIDIRKVDGNIIVLVDDVTIDSDVVSVVLPQQAVTCIGKNLGQIKIYGSDDVLIGSLNFWLEVQPDPLAGGVDSETAIDNLESQIAEIVPEVIGNDYYNKTETDALLADKADVSDLPDMTDYYTKTQTDTLLNSKADRSTTYTKTEVDSALSLKADLSQISTVGRTGDYDDLIDKPNLASVATSGDYDDLINKPTIPAAQVQSDYAQADNTQVDYIKNKPDINAMIAAAIDDILPVGSAGPSAIATFDTALSRDIVDCKCTIVATGGYDADTQTPHPINGYTEANIRRCGVNLWDETWDNCYWNENANGVKVPNASLFGCNDYIPVKAEINICFVSPTVNSKWYVLWYDTNKDLLSYERADGGDVLTVPANACYMTFYNNNTAYSPTYNNDISINLPSTDTTYHAYNGTTYTISFGQTVYGGVLDVTRGKLTVTFSIVDLGSLDWNYMSDPYRFSASFTLAKFTNVNTAVNMLCEIYITNSFVDGLHTDKSIFCWGNSSNTTNINVVDSAYSDAVTFKTAMENKYLCFELATPFDIEDLTPVQIAALLGVNNVFSDTNGTTEVKFKDTIQHYIDNQ